MVLVISKPKLYAAFTRILDTGGLRVSALKTALPMPHVAGVSAVASVSDTYRAAIKVIAFIETSRVVNRIWQGDLTFLHHLTRAGLTLLGGIGT